MPKYKSHKAVWALKIKDIQFNENGSAALLPDETVPGQEHAAPFVVSSGFVERHEPEAPGYFVQYEDGYCSWSPVHAFVSGYTRI